MGDGLRNAAGKKLKCALMGSQSLLVQCGQMLLDGGHEVVAVVSEDDAIVRWATERKLGVLRLTGEWVEPLCSQELDVFFSIGNLRIVPDRVVAHPKLAAINFHDGPLPQYAGLNAPNWALLQRESTHGITWHEMAGGVDEGAILKQRTFDIAPRETALTLNTKCYEQAMESFAELANELANGTVQKAEQDLSARTYFGRYERPAAAGVLDWSQDAQAIAALVRALDFGPYPNPLGSPKLKLDTGYVIVRAAEPLGATDEHEQRSPGQLITLEDKALTIACRSGALRITEVATLQGETLSLSELQSRYALSTGKQLPVLSSDERQSLTQQAQQLARSESFWAKQLRSARPLSLPPIRSEAKKEARKRVHVELAQKNADVVTVVLAWLARIAERDDLDVGWVVNRPTASWLASVVPFRVALDFQDPYQKLGAPIQEKLEQARAKQTYARDLIARTPELPAPHYPVLISASSEELAHHGEASAALALSIDPETGRCTLDYDSAALEEHTVEELCDSLAAFAQQAAEQPTLPLGKLSLVSDQQRQKLLQDWNATARPRPEDATLLAAFARQAAASPDAKALVFRGKELTYRELDQASNQLAHYLRAQGVSSQQPVGLCIERSEELVVAVLGILKAGGAYLPLDPSYPKERLAFMVEDAGVRLIVTQRKLKSRVATKDARALAVDEEHADVASQPTDPADVPIDGEALAYVIYTSGSTGVPKGVMVEHRNVVSFFQGMDEVIDHDPPGTWLAVTSLSFDISVLELLWTLTRGFKVVVASDRDKVALSESAPQSTHPIGFSLFYFASDEGEKNADKYRLLLEGAKFADERGFEAVWTPERHFHAFGGLYPNPSVASAAIAAITERVKIRSGSCVLPLHHPVRVTEEWSLVDNISKGRVGISFAAGWQPNDFLLRPESFSDPKQTMFDSIETVRKLWRGETVSFDGPKGPVEVQTLPRPVQPELPFWITAAGNPSTFEAAGRLGAGILTHLLGQSLEELREKLRVYRQAWKKAGHPGEGHVTLMLHTFVGENEDEVKEQVRGPMKEYLRSSLMLIQQHAWSFPAFRRVAKEEQSLKDNFESLSPEDMEALLDHSFERYYETSGLFGTPARCREIVERLRAMEIDEIGCLIDFGVDSDAALEHLEYLDVLREECAQAGEETEDYSLVAQIKRHQVTHMQCTPSLARMLTINDEARQAIASFEHWMVGGEALPPTLASEIKSLTTARLTNMYGPTETTVWSSTERVEQVDEAISIGRPIANTQLYVLDRHGELLPPSTPGELYIGGAGVTRGYWKRPELTEERFLRDPFRSDKNARLYKTGDLVQWAPNGKLKFLGRLDHQVKIRGYRIELGEVEAAISRAADVRDVAVVAREDVTGSRQLVAYLVTTDPSFGIKALRQALGNHLPEYMVPSQVVTLDRLPLTPNGKVDRKALPSPNEAAAKRDVELIAPSSDTEKTIVEVWSRTLGVDEVSTADNFFEIGGHSLLAVQAHRELREALGQISLTITDIFRFPTAAALSRHIESSQQGAAQRVAQSGERASARKDALKRRAARRGRLGRTS